MRRRAHSQRGAILITIMVVMMVTMLMASTLINHFAVQEAGAIEQQLADIRANWAMMGHVNYALSRASQKDPDLCVAATCINKDASRTDAFTALFRELGAFGSRNWIYSEYVGGAYSFNVQAEASNVDTVDGKLRLLMSVPAPNVGAFDSLSGIKGARMWVDICLTNNTTTCPALTTEGYGKSLITNVLRSDPALQ